MTMLDVIGMSDVVSESSTDGGPLTSEKTQSLVEALRSAPKEVVIRHGDKT